jgi:hypothetical protein
MADSEVMVVDAETHPKVCSLFDASSPPARMEKGQKYHLWLLAAEGLCVGDWSCGRKMALEFSLLLALNGGELATAHTMRGGDDAGASRGGVGRR